MPSFVYLPSDRMRGPVVDSNGELLSIAYLARFPAPSSRRCPRSRQLSSSRRLDPLPPLYHIFFCTVEPFLTILGVIYAVCRPEVYYQNLIPSSSTVKEKLENLVPVGGAGVMAVRQLGSCESSFDSPLAQLTQGR